MRIMLASELHAEDEARLRAAFPGLEFICAQTEDQMLAAAPEAEVLFGGHPSAALLAAAPRLKWVQTRSAGISHLPLEELAKRGILLTNGSGAHGVPIAENILALMLAFAIRLPKLIDGQQAHEWVAGRVYPEKFEVDGQTLVVVGLGDLGGTLARKANALGMTVLGVRRHDLPSPDGVSEVYLHDRLTEALGRADHVALCLPETAETTAILGERELHAMKPTAYLYNAGRGSAIERNSLIRALKEGWIAGAGLDVTDPEPLPPGDPLWSLPNVILTQHTSGGSPHNSRRVTDILIENLGRYQRGEPLRNLVDYARGY